MNSFKPGPFGVFVESVKPSIRPVPQSEKSDYGIDAPGVIRNFYIVGAALVTLGCLLPSTTLLGIKTSWLNSTFIWWGGSWIITSILMVLYAKRGKFKHRDRMLSMVEWNGSENVLDVGTGRGLLMIGAAQKLTTGKSIGIDIWNSEDLSDNKQENTLKNMHLEGVENKTELKNEDVRKMSFTNDSFDVILSNLCVHNLYRPEQRVQACREIARVLKPGGVALISDFRHTRQYAETFKALGLKTELRCPYWKDTFPHLKIVVARKLLAHENIYS